MKKTSLKGYVYNFIVDYDAISVSDIIGIYKYLMKNNEIITKLQKCLNLSSKYLFQH